MAEKPQRHDDAPGKRPLGEQVGQRVQRKLRARGDSRHTAWFGLGMFGLVGWSVAIPSLLGVALGLWLDARWPGRPSWTLTFLIIGVALGCLNAWYWIRQESERD
jgi:ATP synthase protein I